MLETNIYYIYPQNLKMITWAKPNSAELSEYQKTYINLVPAGNILQILENNLQETLKLTANLSKEKLSFRYAEGKWSIPQIIVHIIDSERIFAYRILCIARGDKTPLPGFEENNYAKNSNADSRNFTDILEEFQSVRNATITLLKSFTNETLLHRGITNKTDISVHQIIYMLTGHEMHHQTVLKEKYLN